MARRVHSEAIPLQRAFEGNNGEKYLFGWAIIFDTADAHGTVMTKKFVEGNLERLKKYPAVRFMHKVPLGQIEFHKTVTDPETGRQIKTYINEHGFHVLVRVYDGQRELWNTMNQGSFGFSWAAVPSKTAQICPSDGACFTSLEDGKLFEISVVDSPSHMDCVAHILRRSMEYRGRSFETMPSDYPETCTEMCSFLSCPYRVPENFGKICTQRWIPRQKRDSGVLYPMKRTLRSDRI
jgi:hypothetical protein